VIFDRPDEVPDRVKGLHVGGEEYVTKPSAWRRVARPHPGGAERTSRPLPASGLRVDGIELDEEAR